MINLNSLRTKISVTLSLSMLIVVIGVAINYKNSKAVVEEQVLDRMLVTVESRKTNIESYLGQLAFTAHLIAESTSIKEALINSEYDEANKLLKRITDEDSTVIHFDVMDRSGTVVASSLDSKVGGDNSLNPVFIEGSKRFYINDLHISSSVKQPAFGVSVPVLENKELLGVVLLDLKGDLLFEILADGAGLGAKGETYLVNEEAYVVSPLEYKDDAFLSQKISSDVLKNCLEQKHFRHDNNYVRPVSIYDNYRGVSVVGSYSYLDAPGWCLFAEIDRVEALGELDRILFRQLLTAIVSAIGLFVGVWFVGNKYVIKRIFDLKFSAEKIQQGDINHRIEVKSKDEIGQLGLAFNEMVTKISRYQSELEAKVKSRTGELEAKNKELMKLNNLMIGRELKMAEMKKKINEKNEIEDD